MIANMKTRKDSQWYWLRVDGIEDRSATERAHLFDKVLEFSFEKARQPIVCWNPETHNFARILPRWFWTVPATPEHRRLKSTSALLKSFDPPLELVEFTSARVLDNQPTLRASSVHNPWLPWSSHSSTVIRTHRYSPCCKLLVVCLILRGPGDVLHKIRRATERFFVMFASADDPVEIRLCLSTVYSHLPGGVPPTNRIAIKPWIDQIIN